MYAVLRNKIGERMMKKYVPIIFASLTLALLFAACVPIEGTVDEVLEKAGGGGGPYTVTFVVNGGTPAPQPQKIEKGGKIEDPGSVSLFDVEFSGWYTEPAFLKKWDFDNDTVTKVITLYAKWNFILPLTNVNLVVPYLISQTNGNSIADPVFLGINIGLGNMNISTQGWQQLLTAIETAGKFVSLDISGCTMADDEFNPVYSVSTGKEKIISIVLPDTAKIIGNATNNNMSAFKNFINLSIVEGLNIETIGDYAFYGSVYNEGCTALKVANFPNLNKIGEEAFNWCEVLEGISFPKLIEIGQFAFSGCIALAYMQTDAVEKIENDAFYGCNALTEVSLPNLEYMGGSVFSNCTALVKITFPDTVEIYGNPFDSCTLLRFALINKGGQLKTLEYNYPPDRALASNDGTNIILISYPSASGDIDLTPESITEVNQYAFLNCTALRELWLPDAVTLGERAFWGCTSLRLIIIPNAETLSYELFARTGSTDLIILIGDENITIHTYLFGGITEEKNVTVLVPEVKDFHGVPPGESLPYTYPVDDIITETWGNGFRGKGWWPGYGFADGVINRYIRLTINEYSIF